MDGVALTGRLQGGLLRDGVDEVTRFAFVDHGKALYDVVLTEHICAAFEANLKVYGSGLSCRLSTTPSYDPR